MKALVFDIETSDVFDRVTRKKPEDLTLSVVAIYSYPHDLYQAFTQEELPALWELFRSIDTLIGFNSIHFDTPLLNKYAPMDIAKLKQVDLLAAVRDSLGRRLRLDWIAKGTLGEQKSGHGLEAVEWWKAGEYEKVKQYCIDDVRITRALFEYARDQKKLKYADLDAVHEIPIDTSGWHAEEKPEDACASLF